MNQSRKTRQPDRFMLYMTLMLTLWLVVFVVVLFTQVANPVGSSTPPATANTRPDAPRNPFSSGQFASPEDSQFIPRPRRLDPVQLPPARAYTSIVFGDAPFNPDNFDTQQVAQPPEQTAFANNTESAVPDAGSNPADTTSDTTPNITQDLTNTEVESVTESVAKNIDAEDGGNDDISDVNSDVATAEIDTENVDTENVDTANIDAIANAAEATAVNAADDTPRATPDTSSDAPDTPPTASLEVIADISTAISNQTSTLQDNTSITAENTRRAADITPTAQADIASLDSNLSPAQSPDTAESESTAATESAADTSTGTATATTTNTASPASNTPTPSADIRLEPPPLLPTKPSPAPPALITITFTSQPRGAEVILEDEVIGNTPLELRLPANQDIFYTLAMPSSSSGTSGFRRFSSVVRSPEDTTVAVQLEPISNVPAASIEGFGTISALRGDRANAQIVRNTVAALLEQATAEYQATISDDRVARLKAEIDALEAELARLDAVLAAPAEPTD